MRTTGGCKSLPNIRTWFGARGQFSLHLETPRTRTPISCMSVFATYSPNSEHERMKDMQTSTIVNGKRNGTVSAENPLVVDVVIDGSSYAAHPGERLVDLINRAGVNLSQ